MKPHSHTEKSIQPDPWDMPLPGDVRLVPGDVVNVFGGPHIAVSVNESRATVMAMGERKQREVTTTGGKTFNVTEQARTHNISKHIGRDLLVERRGPDGIQFLKLKKSAKLEVQPTNGGQEQETEDDDMSKKSKKAKLKPRGGLAAEAMAAREAEKNGGDGLTKAEQKAQKQAAKAAAKQAKKDAKAAAGNGESKQSAKAYIEELCNAGATTKKEAIALVVEKYSVTEKAAKGAVNNCRHYQHKEGRPQGEWKAEPKAEKAAA